MRKSSSRPAVHASDPIPPPAPGPFEREVIGRLLRDRLNPVGEPPHKSDGADATQGADKPARLRVKRILARHKTLSLQRAPIKVVVAILFARALDAVPGLVEALRHETPRVVVEVGDPHALATLRGIWPLLLVGENATVEAITTNLHPEDAKRADLLSLVVPEPMKPKDRDALDRAFLELLGVARPILCLSSNVGALLPPSALRAADHRVAWPPLDPSAIAATIHVVTGKPARAADRARLDDLSPTLADLAIAIRSNRSPKTCIARLRDLAGQKAPRSGIGRELGLGQLHGMDEAVSWARATLTDMAAWRCGELPWAGVDSGLLLAGPPGTGKTLLPAVMAAEADMPLVVGSLANWQSQDQGHLGTTLRAMRQAFEEARAKATGQGRPGCILLVDEVDSFADRSKVTHEHRDYVVECANAMLELLSGATPREGVVVIGTTNDASRLDPAMLRPGRLGRTITIGYPDCAARLAMLRVRLGDQLRDADLTAVAQRTERATGATVEQLVADARRIARQAGRPLALGDLLAVTGEAEAGMTPELLHRIAVHEAGHAVVAALTVGTDAMVVALQVRDGAGGWLDLTGSGRTAGTRAEVETAIRVLLSGRAAEEAVLGEASTGAHADLLAATRLAAHLHGKWGLIPGRLLALGQDGPAEILADPGLRAEASTLLDTLYAEVRTTLDQHREALHRVAERLLVERRLDGSKVAALMEGRGDPTVRHRRGAERRMATARRPDHEQVPGRTA